MNPLKKLAVVVAGLTPSMVLADNSLDIRINVNPDPGAAPCVVVTPPVFNIGDIPATGMYHYDLDLVVQCEDSEQGFSIMYPQGSNSNGRTIYSDEYLDVYAGYPNQTSEGGLVRHNGKFNAQYTGCRYGTGTGDSTYILTVGNHSIYPVGGTRESSWMRDNYNACSFTTGGSETGNYVMSMRAIAVLKTMPTGDDLENMPKQIILPMDFIPEIPVDE